MHGNDEGDAGIGRFFLQLVVVEAVIVCASAFGVDTTHLDDLFCGAVVQRIVEDIDNGRGQIDEVCEAFKGVFSSRDTSVLIPYNYMK